LSYKNARALHQKIDHELPGVTPWRRSVIQISGVNEEFELFMRDPVESIKELWANPAYLEHLTYVPERRFADEEKSERIYDELMSGDWAWETQVRDLTLLPDGATLVPVILSSDKTQLCQFRGDKTAYPVYLTIGNISKSIRRKPSFRAQKLIGYLPTVSLDGKDLSADNARLIHAQLFHYAMGVVTSSLHAVSPTDGIELTSGDGVVRLGFPVVAAYVADYPEQALVTCTRYSQTCPKCSVSKDELGEHVIGDPRHQEQSIRTIHHASRQSTRARAHAALKDHGLNLFPGPFFIRLLHCNIHDAITPDILHQIYQGLVKHLCGWLRTLIGDAELDARFKRMPHAHGVRLFTNGITGLTQVSGPEHREICKQLLGCIVDAPGVTERLHIDFAKDAYKATNKKEFWEQMTRWLERRETMAAFDLVLQWRRREIPKPRARWQRLLPPGVYLAKNPSAHAVSFRVLEDQFGAAHFKNSLGEFIANQLQPTAYRRQAVHNVNILQGLEGVDVWYCVKFAVPNLQVDTESTVLHTAHAEPKRSRRSGEGELDARFDTVLVNESEHKETGIEGKRVARLKVIFRIPDEHLAKMGITRQIGHLAYVEWFSRPRNKDSNSGMYPISRSYQNGVRDTSIIEVDTMFRTCQLVPRFGRRANRAWSSNNVLDRCEYFLINNFIDHHTYQCIW
ncbi:hypothetical protein F4604DRAFT_1575913, partial [Suillus subluteus]